MDRSVIADVPRDKYVERCKQRALDYLDRGDLKNAVSSFVNNMDARPDCELPHHLAAHGVSLWMSKDVQRLEGVDRRV
jgi:Tfp pilus assembly protein PilF